MILQVKAGGEADLTGLFQVFQVYAGSCMSCRCSWWYALAVADLSGDNKLKLALKAGRWTGFYPYRMGGAELEEELKGFSVSLRPISSRS